MSNRVEELESRVAELQAAVDGLTEELVETRERLRALEDEERPAAGRARSETVTPGGAEDRTVDAEDGNAEVASAADADEDADAADDPASAAEPAEAEGSSSDSSDSDDIIVA